MLPEGHNRRISATPLGAPEGSPELRFQSPFRRVTFFVEEPVRVPFRRTTPFREDSLPTASPKVRCVPRWLCSFPKDSAPPFTVDFPEGISNDQVTPNPRRDFVLPNQLVVPEGASGWPPVHQTRRFDFPAIADFLRRVRHAVFVHRPEGLLPSTLLPASRRRPKTTLFCGHATGQHFRRSASKSGQTQYRALSIERFCDATPEGVAASPEGFAPATPTEAEVA